MKRPLDDEETMGGNADDPPKRRRGEGPRVELRILLQSKVSAIGEGVRVGGSFTSIQKDLHKLCFSNELKKKKSLYLVAVWFLCTLCSSTLRAML